MLKITDKSLIIEIPTVSPLECMESIKQSITGLVKGYDFKDNNKYTGDIMRFAMLLLDSFTLSEHQWQSIENHLKESGQFEKVSER